MWHHVILYKSANIWQKPSVCRWHEVLPKTWHFHFHMESACYFEEFGIRVREYVVEYWQNLVIQYNTIFINFAAIRIPKLLSVYV